MIKKLKLEEFDFCIFVFLLLSVTLYQLQYLWPWLVKLHVRELLYGYLYLRIIFFYRPRLSKAFILQVLYIVCAFFIGVHTYYAYGVQLAISGSIRFVNVALIAPIAFVLLINENRAKLLVMVWGGVVALGIATVVYQLSGGEMQWLVRGYTAIRGDLVRHRSLLGEPNVGGLAAVLLYIFGFILLRAHIFRYFILCISSFLVLVSLSRAAMLAFLITNLVLFACGIWVSSARKIGAPRSFSINFLIVAIWGILLMSNQTIHNYGKVTIKSFAGEVPGVTVSEDLSDRFIGQRYGGGIHMSDISSLDTLRRILFGGSFSVAGSSAIELKVANAVGPHNGYFEIFLVGGVSALLLFLFLQWETFLALLYGARSGSVFHCGLLLIFVLLSLNMMGYPSMYEPITGSLFWLIVAIANKNISTRVVVLDKEAL